MIDPCRLYCPCFVLAASTGFRQWEGTAADRRAGERKGEAASPLPSFWLWWCLLGFRDASLAFSRQHHRNPSSHQPLVTAFSLTSSIPEVVAAS